MKTFVLATVALFGTAFARCPNDCNGKGICNTASVCECYANYMGNDCSQRVCTFGKAWIDTNIGDLNANGLIDTDQQVFLGYHNTLVGEQYDPNYAVARTDNKQQWDESHFYRECSNKGICNRKTGLCECFPGFEGEGCRRMSCPLDCNGHGRCQLIEDEKTSTEYTLWDQDKIQGCKCDPGYGGPDCSERECPMGADPVEFPYTNIDQVYKIEFKQQTGNIADGTLPNGPTLFTLTYTDDYGDAWTTHAVTIYYQTSCGSGGAFDPATPASATGCVSTAFIANPQVNNSEGKLAIGDVRSNDFLDPFFADPNFLFGSDFLGEQVNNTLKHLPNDKLRDPYVWTVYNPVEHTTAEQNAKKGAALGDNLFIYPSQYTPDFNAATGIHSDPKKTGVLSNNPQVDADEQWNVCNTNAATDSGFCSSHAYGTGPSLATDSPDFRFPMFKMNNNLFSQVETAAFQYSQCSKFSTCVFIRLKGAKGNKKLTLNYNYKPTIYILKDGKSAPGATDKTALLENYDVLYGAEKRGHDQTTGGLVTLQDIATTREYSVLVDGTPAINYKSDATIHVCSRRGLCDYDTGRCDCFFGYTGNNCHIRTPSALQSV